MRDCFFKVPVFMTLFSYYYYMSMKDLAHVHFKIYWLSFSKRYMHNNQPDHLGNLLLAAIAEVIRVISAVHEKCYCRLHMSTGTLQ